MNTENRVHTTRSLVATNGLGYALPSFGIAEIDANFNAFIASVNKYAAKSGVGGMPWFTLGTVSQELAQITTTLVGGGYNGQI